MSAESGRNSTIDVARALGMIFVIAGHVLILFVIQPIRFSASAFEVISRIYAFHMPLFFFLSGLVWRPRRPMAAVLLAALSLIVLALISHLVGVGIGLVANGVPIQPMAVLRSMIQLRSFSLGVTWFLVALAFVRLFYALLKQEVIIYRAVILLLLSLSLTVSVLSWKTTTLQVQVWWAGFVFFAIGAAIAPQLTRFADEVTLSKLALVAAGTAFAGIVLSGLNRGCPTDPFASCGYDNMYGNFMVRLIIGQYGFLPLFVATALLGFLAVYFFSQLIVRLSDKGTAVLVWVGSRSLALLLLNGCFLVATSKHVRQAMLEDYAAYTPWALTLVIISLHLLLLPLVAPVVTWLESLSARMAEVTLSRSIAMISRRPG